MEEETIEKSEEGYEKELERLLRLLKILRGKRRVSYKWGLGYDSYFLLSSSTRKVLSS